jgi:hypothetical protein
VVLLDGALFIRQGSRSYRDTGLNINNRKRK